MQLADEDVDMVDSVVGLRQILADISTADDTTDNNLTTQATNNPSLDSQPSDDSRQPVDSTGEENLPLDNHTPDVESADGSVVAVDSQNAAQVDEKSDEKLENTSEMETKYTDIDGMTVNEAITYSETSKEQEGILEMETKYGDIDKAIMQEMEERSEKQSLEDASEMEIKLPSNDGEESGLEMAEKDFQVTSDKDRTTVEAGDDLDDYDDDINGHSQWRDDAVLMSQSDEHLSSNKLSTDADAAAGADDDNDDAEYHSSSLGRICADYDDIEQVSK